MGWLASMFGLGEGQREQKLTSVELDAMMRAAGQSGSGAMVNWRTALQVTTVLACTKVIAEGVAQVPFKVYQRSTNRVEASNHDVFDLLYRRPNPWQTSFEFRETQVFHAVLTGDAYVHKLRVGSARRVASLELCEPQRMRVKRERDGRIRYFYTPEGGSEFEIAADDMWHLRGPSWNSWKGLEAVRLAREAIGLSIATEAQHADLHRNGARVSGFYSVEGTITPKQFDDLDVWLEKYRQGGERSGKPVLLDRGATFKSTQMNGVDAQHIETRKFQVEEICRAMRVMPIMIGQSDKTSTYASAEQMFLAHVVHTLMPWYERIEQSADVNLLTEGDRRQGFYTKFNPNALMRGASKDRAEYYAKALGAGGQRPWMTQDEVRSLEEMDPYGEHATELGTGAMDATPAEPPVASGDN